MSTLTGRITNGAVGMSAQDTGTMSRFRLHRTQADCLGAGTRGVTEDLRLFRHNRIQREVDHERVLLV